jgi:hypothetical protein
MTSADENAQQETANTEATLPGILNARCDELVARYRDGKVERGFVVSRIYANLQGETAVSDEQRESAFDLYLRLLEHHERTLASARTRGWVAGPNEVEQGEPADEGLAASDEQPDTAAVPSRKRVRSGSPSDADGILRKQPPDERLYAWANRAQLSATILNPNLELTRRMVLNYGRDVKNAKLHLLSTPGVPRYPDTLLGRAVSPFRSLRHT